VGDVIVEVCLWVVCRELEVKRGIQLLTAVVCRGLECA
jgi:hypothetical protein